MPRRQALGPPVASRAGHGRCRFAPAATVRRSVVSAHCSRAVPRCRTSPSAVLNTRATTTIAGASSEESVAISRTPGQAGPPSRRRARRGQIPSHPLPGPWDSPSGDGRPWPRKRVSGGSSTAEPPRRPERRSSQPRCVSVIRERRNSPHPMAGRIAAPERDEDLVEAGRGTCMAPAGVAEGKGIPRPREDLSSTGAFICLMQRLTRWRGSPPGVPGSLVGVRRPLQPGDAR